MANIYVNYSITDSQRSNTSPSNHNITESTTANVVITEPTNNSQLTNQLDSIDEEGKHDQKNSMLNILDNTLVQLPKQSKTDLNRSIGVDALHADTVNNAAVHLEQNVNIAQRDKLPQSIAGPLLTEFKPEQAENKDTPALTFNKISNELERIHSKTLVSMDTLEEEPGEVKQQIQMFDPNTLDGRVNTEESNANKMNAFVHPDLDTLTVNTVHSANEGTIIPEYQGIVRGSMQEHVDEPTNNDNNKVEMIIRQYTNTLNETNIPNHIKINRDRLRKKLIQTGRVNQLQNDTCVQKLPQCIIIGVMKAGTEAFATFLGSNPQVNIYIVLLFIKFIIVY